LGSVGSSAAHRSQIYPISRMRRNTPPDAPGTYGHTTMGPRNTRNGRCPGRDTRERDCQVTPCHGVSMTFPEFPEDITAKA
jgi:hypothetical protein